MDNYASFACFLNVWKISNIMKTCLFAHGINLLLEVKILHKAICSMRKNILPSVPTGWRMKPWYEYRHVLTCFQKRSWQIRPLTCHGFSLIIQRMDTLWGSTFIEDRIFFYRLTCQPRTTRKSFKKCLQALKSNWGHPELMGNAI